MSKIALIIIYNHQYNQNLEVIEQIYGDRFSNIFHLVPFYNGDKLNVIPVYDNSLYFQGYVSQGFQKFYNKDFDHYLFIADDMVLNPIIDENNYREKFKLGLNTCFIPKLVRLNDRNYWWGGVRDAYQWTINVGGVEAQDQLPDTNTAIKLFENFGLEIEPLKYHQIVKKREVKKLWDVVFVLLFKIRKFLNQHKNYQSEYPMVSSYSDIFVVSSDAIKQFCHYCGVFATTKLFVEVGLPTSLVLTAKEIVMEKDLNYQGKALWNHVEFKELSKYNKSLKHLLAEFPSNYLYLHPVKLSKWKKDL